MHAEKCATSFGPWPSLTVPHWKETAETMQLWTQIVGKTRLVLVPHINHTWNSALFVSARGLTTGPMPYRDHAFEVEFDFLEHRLWIQHSDGDVRSLPLEPQSVATFYRAYFAALRALGIDVHVYPVPNELPVAIPFPEDEEHRSYDADWASAFSHALLSAHRVFTEFRAGFIGKVSPVHFFWGGFDLAVTRFSGRRAPRHPGGVPHLPDSVVQDAYSHEVCSAGFWPGSDPYPEAAFYSYAYPEPPGYADVRLRSRDAFYHSTLREFILPYETVRSASSPSRCVREFLDDTYRVAADLGRWDRAALESPAVEREPSSASAAVSAP